MECNKDEATRAKELAEKKMANNDFEGARKFGLKAQNLYPELENISQMLSTCDVHCSAQKMLGSEKDWYGILHVERFSDELTIKKQYRRLALILHPDKNRFPGAEAAFKLIGQAHVVLSDAAKKSLYDSKIRVLARPAPVYRPPNHASKKPQVNKQYGAQYNAANGFSSFNQQQTTWSSSFVRQDTFWTCCPFCCIQYQYQREFVNRSLRCATCGKSFMACEILAQGLGSKWVPPGGQMPSKPYSSQPTFFHEKVVLNPINSKANVAHGVGNWKAVRPGSDAHKGVGPNITPVASAFKKSSKRKASVINNHNTPSVPGKKNDGEPNSVASKRERELKNKIKKQERKFIVESSESSDTYSESEVEVLVDEGNTSCGPGGIRSSLRSSRRKQHISYVESDDDDEEEFFSSPLKRSKASEASEVDKEKPKYVNGENSKHWNQSKSPANEGFSKSKCKEKETLNVETNLKDGNGNRDKDDDLRRGKTIDISGDDTEIVKSESDSDQESVSTENSDENRFECPDPDFNDFDVLRDAKLFKVNQIWACYDTFDGMPRFFAKVRKANASPFEVRVTWLEPFAIDEAYESWVDAELPVGCGTFKLGGTTEISARITFSHQVYCDQGQKRGSLIIYPREGEVWAIIKDWDMNWSREPENHKEFKYQIVEVLSNFVAGSGIKVKYLDKVEGFVCIFHQSSENGTTSIIGPNELYKFSHCVPSFKMTGLEREGVPVGSFELDPASLPLNPDNLYYYSKVKIEKRNMDVGV